MTVNGRAFVAGLVAITGGRAIGVVANVLLVPLFLLYWTPRRYGEWLALSSMVGYLATLDLGMNMAAVNRLTQAYVRGDHGEYAASQRTALFFYLTVAAGGTLLSLGVLLALPLGRMLRLEETAASEAALAAWVLGLLVLWAMPCGSITAVYRTTGNLARSQWIGNTQQLLTIAAIALTLVVGGGVVAVALGQLAVLAVVTLWVLWDLRARLSHLAPRVGRPDRAILATLVRAGMLFVLIIAANALSIQGSVTLLSVSLGGVAVAVFAATRTLAGAVRQIVGVIVNAVWPDVTRLESLGQLAALRTLHVLLIVVSTSLCAGLAAALWFDGPEVFRVWTVGALQPDPWLLRLLLVTVVLQSPWSMSLVFTVATSRHARLAKCCWWASVIGVGTMALLIPRLGTWAVPLGLLVGEVLACCHFVLKDTCDQLGEPYGAFARRLWPGVAGVAAAALAAGWAAHAVLPGPLMLRFPLLVTVTLAAAGAVAWGLWLNPDERATLRRRVPSLTPAGAVGALGEGRG